nr:hypothetical protein [Tanacetum cinerariifolium]
DEDISSDNDRDHTGSFMVTKPELKIGDEFLKILHDNSFNEVKNNEGIMDEDVSSDDDRDHTNSSMITKPELNIGDEFLKILHDNSINGMDGSDVTDHIAKVIEITEWIKIPNVDKDEL